MPTHGKSSSVTVIPKLDGFREVPHAPVHLQAQRVLGSDSNRCRQHRRQKAIAAVKQHRNRESGNVRRQQEVYKLLPASDEPWRPSFRARFHPLAKYFAGVGGRQRNQWLCPRLFEPEHRVPQNVEDCDRGGKSPQAAYAPRMNPCIHLVCSHLSTPAN